MSSRPSCHAVGLAKAEGGMTIVYTRRGESNRHTSNSQYSSDIQIEFPPFTRNQLTVHLACLLITPVQTVAIIGLGYVGFPLGLEFARKGVRVVGVDHSKDVVDCISKGGSHLPHVDASDLPRLISEGSFAAVNDFGRIGECDAVVICVPTPLNRNREPDLSYVFSAASEIGDRLRKGQLVVLESTTYPGTTDEDMRRILEERSGLTAGEDFHLAFSPEREDPGNPRSHVARIPKVVGGFTPACTKAASSLYLQVTDHVVPVSSCRAAEATKLLENIFRSVNIALVNELKMVYAEMGIDIWEVIEAAKTKPFGFMAFYPGPGLGGHCIPIDPFYLTWKAREFDLKTRFIELAGEINTAMPHYVVNKVAGALNSIKRSVNGSRILIVGLAYKPDVADTRESPSLALIKLLLDQGAEVDYHDPFVPVVPRGVGHPGLEGQKSVAWERDVISAYHCVVVATAHRSIDFAQLETWSSCIVDTRNATKGPGVFRA